MADVMLQADINAVFTGYKSKVESAYGPYVQTLYPFVADAPEQSSGEREAYVISALSAAMSRWSGDRDYTDLIRRVKYVENGDPWQKSTALSISDIKKRSRAVSQTMTTAKIHGIAAAAQPDELAKARLQDGASTAWVDGRNFFATNHPENPFDPGNANTWANYNASRNLTPGGFDACIAEMMAYKDWTGKPVQLTDFTLIVPPQLRKAGLDIVEAALVVGTESGATGGNTNTNMGAAKLQICPLLSNESTTWYLAAKVYGVISGLVGQEWSPINVQMLGPGSDGAFERNEIKMGVDRGFEVAHLWPWCIYRNN